MTAAFQPHLILQVLTNHQVKFVVVGAWAAEVQGVQGIDATSDIDLAVEPSTDNFSRIASALIELRAKIRIGLDESLEFAPDPILLAAQQIWNLTCDHGDFDLVTSIAGFESAYVKLLSDAVELQINDPDFKIDIQVASVADVIKSKRLANRAKDLRSLPTLIKNARNKGLIN